MTAKDVLDYWFGELTHKEWFSSSAEVDNRIRTQFADTHTLATQGALSDWRDEPDGRLAEVIVLDQFSRNLFREDPRSFAFDTLALVLAQEAIRVGDDDRMKPDQVAFLYMPFMHSESLEVHEVAHRLFSKPGLERSFDSLVSHTKVLEKFGRYPHRNAALGRVSTAAESAFLTGGRGF